MTYTTTGTSRYELTIGDDVPIEVTQDLAEVSGNGQYVRFAAVNRCVWIRPGAIAMHVPLGSIVTLTHRGKSVDAMLMRCDDECAVFQLRDERHPLAEGR